MALEQYLSVVKRWWWLLVASVLVASVSSYYAVSRTPRIYQATTAVRIGQTVTKTNPTYQDFAISQQLALTYVDMVRRRPVLEGAADALGLPYVPWKDNISARIVPGTELIEIGVRDTSPERARALADEIARQLILQTPTDSKDNRERRIFVDRQLQNLEKNIQETEREVEEERAKLDAANSARAIQQYQGNIAALQQKLSSYQTSYASLAQTAQGGTNYVSIVEPATTPTYPISPQVMETVLLAAAIGLALALAGAFLIEFLDDTIKTSDDVTRAATLPTLGTIARISGNTHEERLIARRDPQSPISESFRALRTNLQFASLDRPIRTLMVTSPDPAEGKSLTVANLAIVMAQGGKSVVLVDADLRRPMQHELFGLNNGHGLSNALLESDPDLSEYSWQVGIDALAEAGSGAGESQELHYERVAGTGDLRVITSGPIPPNPADLVASERMRALIKRLESEADIVLFDAPPTMVVTDAVMLSTRVDGILMVHHAGLTRRARAQHAVAQLRHVDANLVGVVLNRVPSRRANHYGYYYYTPKGDQQDQQAPTRDNKRRFTLTGFARRQSSDSRPQHRRPKWWRTPRRSASSGQPAQTPRSLDKWSEEYGPSQDRHHDLEQHQMAERPESPRDEDSTVDQPIPVDALFSPEPESQGDRDSTVSRPLQLDTYLSPEPESQRGGDRKKTQSLQLDAYLSSQPESQRGEDSPTDSVVEET